MKEIWKSFSGPTVFLLPGCPGSGEVAEPAGMTQKKKKTSILRPQRMKVETITDS